MNLNEGQMVMGRSCSLAMQRSIPMEGRYMRTNAKASENSWGSDPTDERYDCVLWNSSRAIFNYISVDILTTNHQQLVSYCTYPSISASNWWRFDRLKLDDAFGFIDHLQFTKHDYLYFFITYEYSTHCVRVTLTYLRVSKLGCHWLR